jgi:hypothetical protein
MRGDSRRTEIRAPLGSKAYPRDGDYSYNICVPIDYKRPVKTLPIMLIMFKTP